VRSYHRYTETFISLTSKELEQLAIAINKMRPPEGQDPVVLNQIVLKKLNAFRLWLLWRRRREMDMDLTDFDADELQWGLDRMAFEARFVDAEAPEQVIPEKLKSIGFDVWHTFWRQFTTYCSTILGAMAIPIAYVFCEHDEPTDVEWKALSAAEKRAVICKRRKDKTKRSARQLQSRVQRLPLLPPVSPIDTKS
jgi:hypothetical protein